MDNFFDRLVKEKEELDERKKKLDAFLASDKVDTVESTQQSLLNIQSSAMATYSWCLKEWIKHLQTKKLI